MLHSYSPIYKIALQLQSLRTVARMFKDSVHRAPPPDEVARFKTLLDTVQQRCSEFGLNYTSDMAKRIIDKPALETYADIFPELDHLNGSLIYELDREAVFRVPAERKNYYGRDDLFGPEVTHAFPSCARDIEKAGSSYALGQEDACVHHLMLVLERGLKALAARVGVSPYHQSSWQTVITNVETKTKTLLRGPDLEFYREVNAQFGFLKVAFRNHSEHAHDDLYDMPKALHILNQVKEFMRLEKGGLSE
jgi:hypothetical protein